MRNPLLAIVGPTGIGKSALALSLAKRFGGEIVSADSRQVYRYMDVGTAKPSLEDRAAVPHHLIDLIDPDEGYSLALFLRQATRSIQDIQRRSKLPVLVGGTGQWVWALIEGWQVPQVPPNPELRRRLEERAGSEGYAALHAELCRLNPVVAARIDARNVRRVIRALEVCHSSPEGKPRPPQKRLPPYQTKVFGLTLGRCALYRRIDCRVDTMIESGWVDEVHGLLERGYRPELPSLSSLGYREIVRYLASELSKDAAVERIKHRTHRFARHQYNWFRPADHRIYWLDAESEFQAAEAAAAQWIEAS